MSNINTKDHWEKRFRTDWDDLGGDKQSEFFANIAKNLLPEWLKKDIMSNDLSILDWGCAEGDGTKVLAKTIFPNIEGMDFSLAAVNNAKERYKYINFYCEDLLVKNNFIKQYDIFFASNVFEHFEKPWDIFDKVKHVAKKYIILLVPYKEDAENLIPEHYYSFNDENIPLRIDEWQLASMNVVDCVNMENSYWGGKQVMLVYSKNNISTVNSILAAQEELIDNLNEELRTTQSTIEVKNELIDNYLNTIEKQKTQLKDDWLLLNSRRYLYANKIALIFNKLAPTNTIRRKILLLPIVAVRLFRKAFKIRKYISYRINVLSIKNRIKSELKLNESTIVYIGMPWNNIMKQRPHHIAENLARNNIFVIYIDPEDRLPIFMSKNLLVISEGWIIEYLSKYTKNYDIYYMFPAGYPKSISEIHSILDKGFKFIYEYIDELDESISGDLTKQIEIFNKLESLNPSIILASAKKLYHQMHARFSNKVLLNENAVDIGHFKPHKRNVNKAPSDLKQIIKKDTPIIGYYGAMATWLDYELINSMTKKMSHYDFIFIGIDYNGGLSGLIDRPNVHYLGPKNYKDLPSYSNWFDCTIIPFQEGDIAKATSPVKLFEYMAMALPTVCTKDLQECAGYEGVLMSKDKEDFIHNLEKAVSLKNNTKISAKLLGYAKGNTWAARAHDIANKIDDINKEKK